MMKKLLCLVLVLLAAVSCLTACTFTSNISGDAGKAEATPKVQEMISHLAHSRIQDAKALMHPQANKNLDREMTQMISYLGGRDAQSLDVTGVNIKTNSSTVGKSRQEQLSCRVELSDHNVIYVSAVYLSNSVGEGFISFQLVLGIV